MAFKEKHKYRNGNKKQIKVSLLSGVVPLSNRFDDKENRYDQIRILEKLKKFQILVVLIKAKVTRKFGMLLL